MSHVHAKLAKTGLEEYASSATHGKWRGLLRNQRVRGSRLSRQSPFEPKPFR
jgi:hypothetical protein